MTDPIPPTELSPADIARLNRRVPVAAILSFDGGLLPAGEYLVTTATMLGINLERTDSDGRATLLLPWSTVQRLLARADAQAPRSAQPTFSSTVPLADVDALAGLYGGSPR